MAALMGRRRSPGNSDLPPCVVRKNGRLYYGRNQVALGPEGLEALHRYAELRGEAPAATGTFADAASRYLRDELKKKAPKTQAEYRRQLATLVRVFGSGPLVAIRPAHVSAFLSARPAVAGTREKALFSAVFNQARAWGLTDAPNPCAGIRGVKAKRDRYVTDAELSAVYADADGPLRDFLDLAYLTGQRPGDVLRMTRANVQDGALWLRQAKTGAKVRVLVVGPLAAVLERVLAQRFPVQALYLVLDEGGQGMRLDAIRKRFLAACAKAGVRFQLRDIRAKTASDAGSAAHAQGLLGHLHRSTTDGYIRDRAGGIVEPLSRGIAEATKGIAEAG